MEVKDFTAINRLVGKEILDLNMVHDIRTITRHCQNFHIYKHKIICWLSTSINPGHVESEVIHAAARLAARLRDVVKEVDVRLYFLLYNINRNRRFPGDHKNAIRLLLKYYDKACPQVSKLLQPLLESQDFELAFLAAAGLGKNITQFMYSQAEKGSPESKATAISEICERNLTGAFDFLSSLFHSTHDIVLQSKIITSLRKLSDDRIPAFLISLLEKVDVTLKIDVINSLSIRGDKTALGPLYALSRDLSQGESLRLAAADAIAAILKRTGREDEGMLSQTESSNTGSLSLPGENGDNNS